MKDFPMFTTENGAASLILKEVPYRKVAFIKILDSLEPEKLLEECVSFCRICGAEKILAYGHSYLEKFSEHSAILEMSGVVNTDEIANLWPVTEATVSRWRQLYNEKMRLVDHASTLESRDEERIMHSGGAYFIHRNGKLLGIGWMEDAKLLAVASCEKGAGALVMATLQSLIGEDPMTLDVASTNIPARRLYERLGFVTIREKAKWYQIF